MLSEKAQNDLPETSNSLKRGRAIYLSAQCAAKSKNGGERDKKREARNDCQCSLGPIPDSNAPNNQ